MKLPREPAPYHAYLLRCWLERSADPSGPDVWRFSLQNARTGTRRGFVDIAALAAYVEQALASERGGVDPAGPGEA